jgi:outer membrane protein assembly factor BamB
MRSCFSTVSAVCSLLLVFGVAGCGENAKEPGKVAQSAPASSPDASTHGAPPAKVQTAPPVEPAEVVEPHTKFVPATHDDLKAAPPALAKKPTESESADTKPADTKPAETKPTETPPAETKPAESKPADSKSTESKTAVAADPMDWPSWRGPEQDGVSRETGLIDHWDWDPDKSENILWKNDEAGSISSPIIMRGKLYTINRYKPGTHEEGEQVLCLDAATGKKLWYNRHNMFLSDVPAERTGWASCVGDPTTGRVYAFGTNGFVQCLDGETGHEIWSHSMQEEFGAISVFGGRTNFPTVFDDLLLASVVTVGWGDKSLPAHRFFGMDKKTGEVRWCNGTTPLPEDTTFSTPWYTVLENQEEMIFGSSDGAVWSFQPRTGQPIWHYRMSRRGLSVSPLVVGKTIYMAQSEENLSNNTQGMLNAFRGIGKGDITEDAPVWKQRGVMAGKSSSIIVDGRIYQADDQNNLYIFDAATGKKANIFDAGDGRKVNKIKLLGQIVRGSPLYADGKIFLCSTTAWHVFRPTANGIEVVQKMALAPEDEVSASVVVSHGRIYLATGARLYCLGKKDQKAAATPIPPQPVEPALADDDAPAQVQVVPAELLLKSASEQQFHVRLFNSRGQFLREEPAATFSLEGPGAIDKTGLYKSDNNAEHTATILTAKVGSIKGQARIRVVPPLPWKFDFQKIPLVANPKGIKVGEPPITWVGASHRNVIEEPKGFDGRKVLVKVTTIPKGTRSQSWMGPTDLHDYTVQADVRGAGEGEKMPDIGLIAQRYTLAMLGAEQSLQIRYWPPQVLTQFSETIPFAWKPNKWYTLKFRAAVEDGKAILKGKIWPRDEKEPDAWTIEATDKLPNVEGSPGLFGDATKAEVYYDNVQVFPNAEAGKTAATAP